MSLRVRRLNGPQLPQRSVLETSIHAVPRTNGPQFRYRTINMGLCITMSVDHMSSHQFQEHVLDILRVGKVRKDATAFDDKITNEIE